jgi:multidrug efflux pump
MTLLISIALVVLVVSVFLRSVRATIVPAVATVVSLLGTFAVMYLLGFSLNNLSLMALTVATGFVVDDAIVVLENTSRHIEAGMDRMKAALLGAKEVGFTVLSISVSLVAVFIPLLFMQGQVGRLFREFAITLSAAVLISLVISLTTTPMMCAWLLKSPSPIALAPARSRGGRGGPAGWRAGPRRVRADPEVVRGEPRLGAGEPVARALHPRLRDRPQRLPVQRRAEGLLSAAGHRPAPGRAARRPEHLVAGDGREAPPGGRDHPQDPAVATVVGFTGGGRAGGGFMFVNLKPASERSESGQAVIARLRPQLAQVTGLQIFLNTVQDVRAGGRQSNSTYQYTLKSDSLASLRLWATRLAEAMKQDDAMTDVDTDQQDNGVETRVEVDRDSASRLGLSAAAIDSALYNAFGQRQVATIYGELNQYHVIMEWHPATRRGRTRSPTSTCRQGREQRHLGERRRSRPPPRAAAAASGTVSTVPANPGSRDSSTGNALSNTVTPMVPLAAGRPIVERATPTAISHQDGELATTISFKPARGRHPRRRHGGDHAGRGRHRHADDGARLVPGHGARGAAVAGPAGDADPRPRSP